MLKKIPFIIITFNIIFSQLFFSEYAEGSSNNKYLEIYNGTGSDVDLSNYAIARYNNGSTTNDATINLTFTSSEATTKGL